MGYGPDPKDGTNDYDDGYTGRGPSRPAPKKNHRQVLEDRIARHQSQAEYAEAQLAKLEALPDEPVAEDGEPSLIWFTKVFQNGSVEYTYAAVRDNRGLWSTTGPNSPKAYTWDQLIEWIHDGKSAEVWFAASFEPLD